MNEDQRNAEKEETAYVYLLLCADGSFYCGYTDDPERRLRVHNSGRGAKYTRSRRPCRLVYTEKLGSKSEALRREAALKKLKHPEKALLAERWRREKDGRTEDPL